MFRGSGTRIVKASNKAGPHMRACVVVHLHEDHCGLTHQEKVINSIRSDDELNYLNIKKKEDSIKRDNNGRIKNMLKKGK